MRLRIQPAVCLVAAVVVALACVESPAQTTSQGLFGSRTVGSSISPGTRTMTSSPTGRGGLGGGLGGLGAVGTGGTVAGLTSRGDTSAGQITGTERFVRGNRQPGQFVGTDSADATNFFSALGSTLRATSAAGQLQGQTGQPNNGNRGGSGGGVPYRISYTPGFAYSPPSHSELATRLTTRLARLPQIESRVPIEVAIEGRTAILRGAVATEHDRELAERLIRLEPGVDQVANELTLAPPLPPQEP